MIEKKEKGKKKGKRRIIKGKVFKYGDDINTDVIFPGKYTYTIEDPKEMATHALEDLDPDFVKKVKKGDVIVAGKNFGCGSSREQAVTSVKYAGIGAIIAESFARIYYRNAINNGLFPIQCPEAAKYLKNGNLVTIDVIKGEIKCRKIFRFTPFSDFVMEIIDAGGLLEYTKNSVKGGQMYRRKNV